MRRCEWCEKDDLYRAYHDNEWGEVTKDQRALFELLCLEIFQAGLSWHTILKKREAFRQAFLNFEPNLLLGFKQEDVANLMQNPKIIRNEKKIIACINNASCFLKVSAEFGSFWDYLLSFTPNNMPLIRRYDNIAALPASDEISLALAKDMKKRGFKFFGAVVAYSYLQACGILNEHLSYCFKAKT